MERSIIEPSIIETRNVTKKFKNQLAVNDISLKIPEGKIYGLLGPNGAGKSTLLKMLTGILKPTTGDVLWQNEKWERKHLRQIGALIEHPPIYPNLTAYENLKVRTMVLGLPESKIEEVLQVVGLTNTGRKTAGKFSLGMKQRLGIATALIHDPKVLILDEPTNGLDPLGIHEFRELIKSFPSKGMTVIISSHILNEIEKMADRIGIITDGVLGYEEDVDKIENLEEEFIQALRRQR